MEELPLLEKYKRDPAYPSLLGLRPPDRPVEDRGQQTVRIFSAFGNIYICFIFPYNYTAPKLSAFSGRIALLRISPPMNPILPLSPTVVFVFVFSFSCAAFSLSPEVAVVAPPSRPHAPLGRRHSARARAPTHPPSGMGASGSYGKGSKLEDRVPPPSD